MPATAAASPAFELWDPAVPFPAPEALAPPPGSRAAVVHRADDAYGFLHDCQIAMHRGTLFASWYNCPRSEMEEASLIRGRCSTDGGNTWSAPVEIARAPGGAFMYVPNVFGVHDGALWCFALRMGEADRKLDGLDVFRLDDASGAWRCAGHLDLDFLPNHPPIPLDDGRAVMAGRIPAVAGERPLVPAVAFSAGADWCASWEIRPLLAPGETLPCPETALLPGDGDWIAIIRPGDWVKGNPGRTALVSTSNDGGRTWSPPVPSNLPMQPAKAFAGTLGTGQRYLIGNSPGRPDGWGRELLTLAVTRPGENRFSRMWALQDGPDPELGCGPEWSYPCAVEADGTLYVIYTSEKRHSVLRAIPVTSLGV